MGKFKLDDKVRLKRKALPTQIYNGIKLLHSIKSSVDANGFVSIVLVDDNDDTVMVRTAEGDFWVGEDALELYQEDCSYKIGNTLIIGGYKGLIGKDSVGYFLNLESQFFTHCINCDKLKKLFGKDIFTSIAHKCNAVAFDGAFPDFRSIEDLVTFVNELNKLLDSKKESDLTTTKNYQNNEIKFQRAKASCKRGIVPAGSTICGRKDKIAIGIGHLSYQVCNC